MTSQDYRYILARLVFNPIAVSPVTSNGGCLVSNAKDRAAAAQAVADKSRAAAIIANKIADEDEAAAIKAKKEADAEKELANIICLQTILTRPLLYPCLF